MRYTKELQAAVCKELKNGTTPQECAEKYNLPIAVIVSWGELEVSSVRAKEIALRKYIAEITETEADVTDMITEYLKESISDDEFLDLCDNVSKKLTVLVSEIVKSERNLNFKTDDMSDAEKILLISEKWLQNRFICLKNIRPTFR